MTLVDRFVCRREGHTPSMKFQGTLMQFVSSYICPCARCGKLMEVHLSPPGKKPLAPPLNPSNFSS